MDHPPQTPSEDERPEVGGGWSPDSWRDRKTLQQPQYRDESLVEEVFQQLRHLPPLVTSWEIEA